VKRAVRVRDQNQCTFVGTSGRRCSSKRFLEFDHVVELSRGGVATVDGIRLRCRAHNQYTAAQTLGAELMSARRRAAIEAREKARQRAAAETAAVREAATGFQSPPARGCASGPGTRSGASADARE